MPVITKNEVQEIEEILKIEDREMWKNSLIEDQEVGKIASAIF